MAFWKHEKNASQTLSDLIRGLQHSVNTAMEMIETRNIELLGRYFTRDGTPVKRRIYINEDTGIDVPLISIVNPSTVNIKEVEMDFDVQVLDADLRQKQPQEGFKSGTRDVSLDTRVKRSNLEISFEGKKERNRMHVRIRFESAPVPEGLTRIISEYDKMIDPIDLR